MADMIGDLIWTEIDTVRAFDLDNGALLAQLDEMQSVSISQSEETTEITGKNGRRLSTIKRNKSMTVSGNNGIISGGLMAIQTGSAYGGNVTRTVLTAETLKVSNAHTATITGTPADTDAITAVLLNEDGTQGASYVMATGTSAAAAAASSTINSDGVLVVTNGKFTYSSKVLTFDSGVTEGTQVIVYYTTSVTASGFLADYSDKFAKKVALYVDGLAEDKCGHTYHVQFYFPKADFNGNFSLDLGDSQVVHAFEATVLAGGGCDSTLNGAFFTYTVFGVSE